MKPQLTPQTILQRIVDFNIKIRSNIYVEIEYSGRKFKGDKLILAILDIFSTPKSLYEGVEELSKRVKGVIGWIDLTSQIVSLYHEGILLSLDQHVVRLLSDNRSFDASDVHIRMLNDYQRTISFQKAIFETVTSNDVVLDIGAGTGVLAVTAALAGAKHVYAIERTFNLSKLAHKLFEINGVADRITLLEGNSTEIELPEKADVLVSEIIGNDPLGENILMTIMDATTRLLKTNARFIPDILKIYGLPVTIPSNVISKHKFTEQSNIKWHKWYGIDFSPFIKISQNQDHSFFVNTHKTKRWPFLSEPILLKEVNLKMINENTIKSVHNVTFKKSGILNGIIVYFEVKMGRTVEFSIHPSLAALENNWASKVWMPGVPLSVSENEKFDLHYEFRIDEGSVFRIIQNVNN